MPRKPLPEINENDLAVAISKAEGGFVEATIAQIKECLKVTLQELAKYTPGSVIKCVYKHKKK